MSVALFLIDRLVDDGTAAEVIVMLPADHPKVAWARRRGITLAPDAKLTGGTEREVAMNALHAAGFEVIAITAHTALGDGNHITINQWVTK